MADAATRQLVQKVVLDQVAAGAMFTAFDITLMARNQGVQLRHDEGRDIVHEMFQTGAMGAAYQRSIVDIGASAKPFLYHRFDSDPKNYQAGGSKSTASTPPAPTSPPPASQSTANTTPGSAQPGFLQRFVKTILGGTQSSTPNPSSASPSSGQTSPSPAGSKSSSPPSQQPTVVSRPQSPSMFRGATNPRAASSPTSRPNVNLNLDAADFLPITRDELKQKAKGINLWGSPWFGRRDLIPPISDERTKLIDRAMVSNGLLTPEELAEIHRVGAEMDIYRPTQILINSESQRSGNLAVEEDRQRRAAEKKKKKEEAAAQREARRQAIAHRRANDIVFLGANVSHRLHQRESDAAKLKSLDLPMLATPADVAAAIQITIPRLRWLAFHREVASRTHYVHFEVAKKSGGVRMLSAPHESLELAQRWILENVLNKLPVESSAHGFAAGRSIVTNAKSHVGQQVVINMDLEGFFPNVTFPRVRRMFERLGYSPAVATIFALLCTECPRRAVTYGDKKYLVATGRRGLPQGACTSPAISNQVTRRLDRRLQGLARRLQLNYTRYADDISISGGPELLGKVAYVMACVRHIAQDDGFKVNPQKTRVLRRNAQQNVTGIVVNDKASISRKTIRRIRAILHRAKHEGLAAQNRSNHPNFRSWLEGMIAYLAMSRPDLAAKYQQQLQSIYN